MAWCGHAMPRHGHAIVKVSQLQCLQVMEMVQGSEVMLKDSRGGQGWTWSKPNF